MSAKDFRGRLLEPVIASTATTVNSNNRFLQHTFSLRTMMSGAARSSRRFRRLLRLMRRYRSFRFTWRNDHHPAGTSGRRSGGRTGRICQDHPPGLLPDRTKASSSLMAISLRLVSSWFRSALSRRVSHFAQIQRLQQASIASAAPILASSHRILPARPDTALQSDLVDVPCWSYRLDNHIRFEAARVRYHATAYRAADRYGTAAI